MSAVTLSFSLARVLGKRRSGIWLRRGRGKGQGCGGLSLIGRKRFPSLDIAIVVFFATSCKSESFSRKGEDNVIIEFVVFPPPYNGEELSG